MKTPTINPLLTLTGAVASSEVKQKLQEFVLTKKQREAVAKDMSNSPPQFRHPWYVLAEGGVELGV